MEHRQHFCTRTLFSCRELLAFVFLGVLLSCGVGAHPVKHHRSWHRPCSLPGTRLATSWVVEGRELTPAETHHLFAEVAREIRWLHRDVRHLKDLASGRLTVSLRHRVSHQRSENFPVVPRHGPRTQKWQALQMGYSVLSRLSFFIKRITEDESSYHHLHHKDKLLRIESTIYRILCAIYSHHVQSGRGQPFDDVTVEQVNSLEFPHVPTEAEQNVRAFVVLRDTEDLLTSLGRHFSHWARATRHH